MRQHKYQAWHKRERKMYEVTTLLMGIEGKDLVRVKGKSVHNELWVGDDVELREYTGIVDEQGKDIYEGDIVKWSWKETAEKIGIVKFGEYNVLYSDTDYGQQAEEGYGYYVHWIKPKPKVQLDASCNMVDPFVENTETLSNLVLVIGNVWENSNLLKEQS